MTTRALAVVLSLLLGSAHAAVPLLQADSKEAIESEYLVVFNENTTEARVASHMVDVRARLKHPKSGVLFEYSRALRGYALRDVKSEAIKHLQTLDTDLAHIEPNQIYTAQQDSCVEQREATWGLVRTSQRDLNINGKYRHSPGNGRGVTAYILDTGVYYEHAEFEGRAVFGFDATGEGPGDENGHGTHVAGTVMSARFGVAKGATAVDVKVLSGSGAGSTAGIVAGIDWAAKDNDGGQGVANLSLGGLISMALNQATDGAFAVGLAMIVASGNSNGNSCLFSPASAADAFTVDASDNTDRRSSFSNHGACSSLFAPGTSITSTWIGDPWSINTISGTSMAAPHVAGVAAVMRQKQPEATVEQIYKQLLDGATEGAIDQLGGSPNLLLYKDCA